MLTIENIKEVKQDLINLGFTPKTFEEWERKEEYLIWYEDERPRKNQSPDLKISCETGIIYIPMCSTYFQRGIPNIVKTLFTDPKYLIRRIPY